MSGIFEYVDLRMRKNAFQSFFGFHGIYQGIMIATEKLQRCGNPHELFIAEHRYRLHDRFEVFGRGRLEIHYLWRQIDFMAHCFIEHFLPGLSKQHSPNRFEKKTLSYRYNTACGEQ